MRMHPVPLLLMLAATLPAMELAPGFSVDGWVEATGRAEGREPLSPRPALDAERDEGRHAIDAAAAAALIATYRVDDLRLRADVIVSDQPQFADSDSNVLLEQAFIDWQMDAQVTWRAGRFQTTWLGWEAFHTAGLWRVNHSAAWDWNVQNHSLQPNQPFVSDGVGLLTATADQRWRAEFYVVDDVLGDTDQTRGTDLTTGASFSGHMDALGRVELGLAYDPRSVAAGANRATHAFAVDLNADLTAWREQGWFFAAEVQFHHHPDLTVGDERYGNDLVVLAMANRRLVDDLSLTVMLDYVDRGLSADDNAVFETAVALMAQPRPYLRWHAEAFYWAEQADRADSYGVAAVVNVALP